MPYKSLKPFEENPSLCKTPGSASFICPTCKKPFRRKNGIIRRAIMAANPTSFYCSNECYRFLSGLSEVSCKQCDTKFVKRNDQIRKTNGNFCSRSCAATYNNTHKTHGTRRSKLEKWLGDQLKTAYPKLDFDFNNKEVINSELDIYVKSLRLAFEINGIFHYEPIYGKEKLASIKNNDERKFQACLENNIELCIINTSMMKRFTSKRAQVFLNVITKIISKKILGE